MDSTKQVYYPVTSLGRLTTSDPIWTVQNGVLFCRHLTCLCAYSGEDLYGQYKTVYYSVPRAVQNSVLFCAEGRQTICEYPFPSHAIS